MKIIWTDFASNTLSEIYKYYKEVAGENVAKKIKTNIFSTTRQLEKHPAYLKKMIIFDSIK